MALDVDKLIADAKAAREKAKADQAKADKIAAALRASQTANKDIKDQVSNQLAYANALYDSIKEMENKLTTYAVSLGRGDKLGPAEQKEFDKLLIDYKNTDKTYQKTIEDVNIILAKAPSPTSVSVKGGKAEVAPTAEERAAAGTPETKPSGKGNEIAPRDYAKELTGAAKFIYSMKDSDRLVLSKQLKAAGFNVPESGKYSDALAAAYQSAISGNQLRNSQLGLNQSLAEFLVTKAGEPGVGGTGGTKSGTTTGTTVFSPSDAALYINSEFQQFLKRDATPAEISSLTKQLTDAQRKNPDKVTTDANGNTTRVQGLNAQGFLDSLIKKNPEFTKKLEGKVATTLESVLNTAKDNSIVATQGQIDGWTNRLKNGEDAATIQHEIRNLASIGRPDAIAKQLLAGNDLGTILSPYKQYMQSTLEIPAEQIALTDPSLQMAIASDKPMSLYDYQNALRKDNRWQYTQNAKTDVSNSIQQVLKDFGFMG